MNPSTAQALVIADELIRLGVRHVVVCPGSRNAPLSMAFAEAAASGRITLHVRIDERSAGFLTLGLSKGMGYGPIRNGLAAVVCTSGTAVANLHPAVLEAAHTDEPIVLLTADRPPELIGSGANQTTLQHGMFEPHVSTVDFPVAERGARWNGIWRGIICRVLGGSPVGPVHINIPFRPPLLSDGDNDWPEPLSGRAGGEPWTTVASEPSGERGQGVELLRRLGSRTLMLVGEAGWRVTSAAGEVARQMDWPLVVEPPSLGPRHALSAAPLLINSMNPLPPQLRPDDIVVVGRPTLFRGMSRLLASGPEVHLVCDPRHWADEQYVARSAVSFLGMDAVRELANTGELTHRSEPAWSADWRKMNGHLAEVTSNWLAAQQWPTGLHVARDLLRALPSPALLFVGTSNAVRDISLMADHCGDLRVFTNRGLAGIDGSVSTMVGVTLAAQYQRTGIPGYALLGDLTFLHDVAGLFLSPGESRPDLTIVVNNDNGGGIFSLLEQGEPAYAKHFDRVFGTPHDVDLGALCAGYGVPHIWARTAMEFADAVRPAPGLRVVEVRTERAHLRELHERLKAAVTAAFSE